MERDIVKDLFVQVIQMAQEKYQFELNKFIPMDNHFHFIIRTLNDEHTISKIIQYIKSVFARKYNRIMNRTGPVWNERFKSKIVEEAKKPRVYFVTLLWYIAYNPVRKGIVSDPRDYKYSSINSYLDENYICMVKITFHPFYLDLGSTFEERRRILLEYEDRYLRRIDLYFE